MSAYYNEIDPFCVEWLKNLTKAKLIADGEVDGRSITEVQPEDLRGFKQCHFFAGIGLWSLALRNAGVGDSEYFWSGSCPCQPFSNAGHQKAEKDERHLWPKWFRLIRECNPPRIVGEQVASAIRFNWLDLVQSDLESQNYAVGKAVLGASSVGQLHRRYRLFFVADSCSKRRKRLGKSESSSSLVSWRRCSQEDLLKIADSPFVRTESWPQPIIRALDDDYPSRVGALHAYGNAIVPKVATEFIKAYLEARGEN